MKRLCRHANLITEVDDRRHMLRIDANVALTGCRECVLNVVVDIDVEVIQQLLGQVFRVTCRPASILS
ncbi:hypothetical protein HSE3_gp022 [Klebsiella phage vB_KleS-HSE3]|nr:hypothetical protein HSE3_gp022 [Klebsiella phage vB_KleS-HSE3]